MSWPRHEAGNFGKIVLSFGLYVSLSLALKIPSSNFPFVSSETRYFLLNIFPSKN